MDFEIIKNLDKKNYMPIFNRRDICFTYGNGSKLYDTYGKEYTDFFGGIAVSCLGYSHKKLTNAIAKQAKKLIHTSGLFYSEPNVKLCKALLSGTHFNKVMLSNSGAEANECAIKLLRKYFYTNKSGKYKIITLSNSFHGRTLATLTATGQSKYSKPYSPLPDGFLHAPFNDFDALKNLINSDPLVGGVMLECIQGESGVFALSEEYVKNAAALCKEKGILLIIDEVQTGMGRTGDMFCFTHYGIKPDIITLAKGLGGGVPIGACLATDEVASSFEPGDHGSTFGGNPLACAAALVVIEELKKGGLLKEVKLSGDYLLKKLNGLKDLPAVKIVRGLGLLIAVELNDGVKNSDIADKMAEAGFIIGTAGANSLRFAPPYIITFDEIDSMVCALEQCMLE